jgi:hypothetical protein
MASSAIPLALDMAEARPTGTLDLPCEKKMAVIRAKILATTLLAGKSPLWH